MGTYPFLFSAILIALSQGVFGAKVHKDDEGSSALLLTPFIKSGNIEEAKKLAFVNWGSGRLEGINGYSGFLTVNETTKSNLFFWFVPSMVDEPEDSPIMVWLNGGPGVSSLFGLFIENGPFKVKKRGRIPKLVLRVRKDTWARKHNMLYIDSPVGTGYSFTESEDGYAKSQADIIRDLHTFLGQFFQMFPEFTKQDMYLAGESYAGKTIPSLGIKIHEENAKANATKINLKGLILGAPLTDPATLTESYADYYYALGLVDENGRKYMTEEGKKTSNLVKEGKLVEAHKMRDALLCSKASFLRNTTGFQHLASALETKIHKKRDYFNRFLNQSSTKKVIHVSDQAFVNVSTRVAELLYEDFENSYKDEMAQLLSLKYKSLVYVGQMDLITPHVGVANFLRSMNFVGKEEFDKSDRRIIRDSKRGDVSGYVKSYENLFYVIIRNAGHHAPADQPRWTREIVERFVVGTLEKEPAFNSSS